MKILIFGIEYKPIIGGGGSYVEYLINGLAKTNNEVLFVTSGAVETTEIINDNLKIKRYKIFNDLYYGNGDLFKGIDIIINNIIEFNPDVIHPHHSMPTLITSAANMAFQIPLFVTHLKTPDDENMIPPVDSKRSLYNYVNAYPHTGFVAASLTYKNALKKIGISDDKITLIYPGVNREIFKKLDHDTISKYREKLNISPDDVVILVPIKIRKRKGLEFLQNTLEQFKDKSPNIKIIITGLPENEEERRMLSEFKNKIKPITYVEHDEFSDSEMPILYNLAKMVLLVSKGEGLGMVLLEAMACGCPVIGTDVDGINEVIVHSVNGELVPYGDTNALESSINNYITNGKLCAQYIENAFTILDDKFNLDLQANNHLEMYSKYLLNTTHTVKCILLIESNNGSTEIVFIKNSDGTYAIPAFKLKIGNEPIYNQVIRYLKDNYGECVIDAKYDLDTNQMDERITIALCRIKQNDLRNLSGPRVFLPFENFAQLDSVALSNQDKLIISNIKTKI